MEYSTINTTKWGDCTQCSNTNVACVKVKKDLVCTQCNDRNKALIQIKKQKDRNALRSDLANVRKLAVEVDGNREKAKNYGEMDRWFRERRKEMKGKCANCNGDSCKYYDKYYKFSIAHLLPKAYFPSVATHPDNWIELCHFGNSCHTNYDNKMIDLIDLNCFDTVIQKFTKIYPFIAAEEKRRIPPILIEYLKTEI